MEIPSITSTQVIQYLNTPNGKTVANNEAAAVEDQLILSSQASDLARYAELILSIPECRANIVAFYKDKLKKGSYPSPQRMAELTRLVGSLLAALPEESEASDEDESSFNK